MLTSPLQIQMQVETTFQTLNNLTIGLNGGFSIGGGANQYSVQGAVYNFTLDDLQGIFLHTKKYVNAYSYFERQ